MSCLYRPAPDVIFRTREEIDAAYDIEASVASFADYAAFFDRASAAARAELDHTPDIAYGTTRAETLDVYPGDPGGPVVFFIHGGYWRIGSSKEEGYVARGFVGRGASVVVPNYGLVPQVRLSEIVRQLRCAFRWTKAHISTFGGSADRIVVAGHSAGAHLAACLLRHDWYDDYGLDAAPIAGACLLSGLYDLRPLRHSSMQADFGFSTHEVLEHSPMLGLPERAPPLLVCYGSAQPAEFVRQSRDYFRAWRRAGLRGECWERPGLDHFNELEDFLDPQSELVSRILQLAG